MFFFLSFHLEYVQTFITRFLLLLLLSFFLLPPKVKKLNISAIYNAIIVIFSANLPMIFINKFCIKGIIQPPCRRTSRTSPRWSSTKKAQTTQKFKPDPKMVDILWHIFKKSAKQFKTSFFGKLLWKCSKIVLFWVQVSIIQTI